MRNGDLFSHRLMAAALVAGAILAGLGLFCWNSWQQKSEQEISRQLAAEQEHAKTAASARAGVVNARAKDCLQAHKYQDGLDAVDEVLDIVEVPELLETKVDLLWNSGRRHEALEFGQKLLKYHPREAQYHWSTGNLAFTLGDFTNAVVCYATAAQLEPTNHSYLISWAMCLVRVGQSEQGIAVLQKLVEQEPDCLDCWYDYGEACFQSSAVVRALEIRRKAAALFPHDWQPELALAQILDVLGRQGGDPQMLNEAAKHYLHSLELSPTPHSVAAQRYLALTGTNVPPELEELTPRELELELRNNSFYVRARINGVDGRFLLDTGASHVSVYQGDATRFQLKPTTRVLNVETAAGKIFVPVAYGEVELGKLKADKMLICLIPDGKDRSCDGLLGLDVLRRLGAKLEVERRRLRIEGRSGMGDHL
jgi:clan AA aspartic protease (TIGR02281 family)